MMDSLSEVSSEERKREQLLERWKYLLDLYQEQPHLLDPHLPTILGTCYPFLHNLLTSVGDPRHFGAGSVLTDPDLALDPDPISDPTAFFSDFKDAAKIIFLHIFFL